MELLMILIEIALKLIGLGVAVLLNIIIWGGITAIYKRGKKNGNDKNIH